MPPISVALIRKRAEHNEGCVSTLEVRNPRSRRAPSPWLFLGCSMSREDVPTRTVWVHS
jgi:hypothetical protein